MANMRQTPGQLNHRAQWQLDVIRENQGVVSEILCYANSHNHAQLGIIKMMLNDMYKNDRDALLQPGGIFTDEQLEELL